MIRPYYTSHEAKGIPDLDILLLRVADRSGRVGWGEACPPIDGYSPETAESAWTFLSHLLPSLLGPLDEARLEPYLRAPFQQVPFALSAIAESLSELSQDPLLAAPAADVRVELVGTVNTLDRDEAAAIASKHVESGYRTLKVKIGFDADEDAARVTRIHEAVQGRARLRVDANRAYDAAAARRFARGVPAEAIEFFEQPFERFEWEATRALGRECPLPLMLDESIFGVADIAKAAELGCVKAVKLKMCKVGGPRALAQHMRFAAEKGLKVVVGNGFASDFACYREALCCARSGLATAGEMNGFLKLTQGLLDHPPTVEGPRMVIKAGPLPKIREAALEPLSKRSAVFD